VDASLLRSLRSNYSLAETLATAEHLTGSWRYLLTERDKLKTVTGKDVQRVAQKYFKEENRTVAEMKTKPRGPAGAGGDGSAADAGEGQ
jgi:predicted Zn-dependent peptidase